MSTNPEKSSATPEIGEISDKVKKISARKMEMKKSRFVEHNHYFVRHFILDLFSFRHLSFPRYLTNSVFFYIIFSNVLGTNTHPFICRFSRKHWVLPSMTVLDTISNVLAVLYDARSLPLAVLERRSVMAVKRNPLVTGSIYIYGLNFSSCYHRYHFLYTRAKGLLSIFHISPTSLNHRLALVYVYSCITLAFWWYPPPIFYFVLVCSDTFCFSSFFLFLLSSK